MEIIITVMRALMFRHGKHLSRINDFPFHVLRCFLSGCSSLVMSGEEILE
jgi:hypothetical protein